MIWLYYYKYQLAKFEHKRAARRLFSLWLWLKRLPAVKVFARRLPGMMLIQQSHFSYGCSSLGCPWMHPFFWWKHIHLSRALNYPPRSPRKFLVECFHRVINGIDDSRFRLSYFWQIVQPLTSRLMYKSLLMIDCLPREPVSYSTWWRQLQRL
jgi:hypothetical protein